MRAQKGITLVALIITIIVLLILAVVAIAAVNNTGIIQHAQNAATDYQTEQTNENTVVHNASQIMDYWAENPTKN